MTVSSIVRIAGPYFGTGLVSTYPFAFKVFSAADVVVQSMVGDALDTLTLNSDYTVSLNANQNDSPGGNVVLTAPLVLDVPLTIGSQLPNTQPTKITNAGGYFPAVTEDSFDRSAIQVQQLAGSIGQGVRIPELTGVPVLPDAATRTGQLLSFDFQGNPSLASPLSTPAVPYFLAAGSGAVAITIQDALRSFTTSARMLGVPEDGVTDCWPTLQAALNRGERIWLTPGVLYRVSKRLRFSDGSGLLSNKTAVIYGPAANFNNTSLAGKYADNSCILDMSGLTVAPFTPRQNVILEGVIVASEVADGRFVDGIVARNVNGLIVQDVEVYGLPVGRGFCMASVGGQWSVTRLFVHDMTSSAVWVTQPQITALEIDQDRVNNIPTMHGTIRDFKYRNITVGGPLLATWNYQTDGLNIASPTTRYLNIDGVDGDTAGEAIDNYGSYITFANINLRNSYLFAMKFIHGASFCSVSSGTIENAGIAGVLFNGSLVAGEDVNRNSLAGVSIAGIDYLGVQSAEDTACIKLDGPGSPLGTVFQNTVVGCSLTMGANGKYGWLDKAVSGSNNYGESINIAAGGASVKRILVVGGAGSGSCRLAGHTAYETDLA